MKLTIARRIGLVATIPALIIMALVTMAWLSISTLSTMQDEGMTLVRQATAAQNLAEMGPRLYRVIADSEINHDLVASKKEWAETVERESAALEQFAKTLDTPQKRAAFDAGKSALSRLIQTYETEMLPALRTHDDITQEIRDLDGKIDGLVKDLGESFDQLTKLAAAASETRDALFDGSARFFSLTVLATGVLGFIIALAASLFIGRSITRPMAALQVNMESMAAGNYGLAVAGVRRGDELGAMARTVETFRSGLALAEASRLEREQAQAGERAHLEARTAIADRFATRMEKIGQDVFRSSSEVAEAAKSLSATAEDTRRQAQAVLGSAEEASANVQTVAASTEEMSSSISEIANQVARSNSVANSAAAEAARTEADVKALSEAANKIGEVVELINNIAGQTNLLALNATIEAARAGESGRGFAVVASEVKQLAAQTARATEEIGAKIAEIQAATNRTVTSIDRIVGTVGQIQQISTLIAAAIEEQGAATGEISSNTHLAARGTQNVTSTIDTVGRAAQMTGTAATQLTSLSGNLNTQATDLQHEVSAFVQQLRAG